MTVSSAAVMQAGARQRWWHELQRREPTLAVFALVMLLAAVPTLVALGLDPRQVHGIPVWIKPLKFMLSLALFAATTAWFFDLLPAAQRAGPAARAVVWTIVAAGTFEVGYISLQAALGQASHYNLKDALHRTMYQLMGIAAMLLMLSQLLLAHQIWRHGRADAQPLWRTSVLLGLVLSFVLVVASAGPLSNAQPPAGSGLPFLGWHLGGGDLRPAHFLASHAQQALPLAGWLMLRAGVRPQLLAGLLVFALLYTGLWLAALLRGLQGAVWLPPPF